MSARHLESNRHLFLLLMFIVYFPPISTHTNTKKKIPSALLPYEWDKYKMLRFCCKHFVNSFSLLWWLSLWVEFLTHTNTPIRALLWYNSLVLWSAVFVYLPGAKHLKTTRGPKIANFSVSLHIDVVV